MSEYLGDVSLALPFSGVMAEEQVDYVCRMLSFILEQADSKGEECVRTEYARMVLA